MRLMLRVFVTLANALAVGVLALDSSNVMKDSPFFFKPTKDWVVVALVVLIISAIYGLSAAGIERRRARRRSEIAIEVSEILFPLWYNITSWIVQPPPIDDEPLLRETFGVNVWLIPSWYARLTKYILRNKRMRSKLFAPPLWRASQYRIHHTHEPTGIVWRRKTGVIGVCWRTGKRKFFDLRAEWANISNEADWNNLTDDVKMGLTFDEHEALKEKYGSVLAMPILRPRRDSAPPFLGCITIDQPALPHIFDLNSRRVRNAARTAADQIGGRINKTI